VRGVLQDSVNESSQYGRVLRVIRSAAWNAVTTPHVGRPSRLWLMRWGFPLPHFGFPRRGPHTSSPTSPSRVFGNAEGGNFPPSAVGRGARFLLLAPDRIRLVPFARSPRTTVATATIPAGFARFDRCEVTHRPGHTTVRAGALHELPPRIRTGLLLEPVVIASLWMGPLPGAPSATPLASCVRVQRAPDRCVLRNRLAQAAVTARSHNASRECTSAQLAQSGDPFKILQLCRNQASKPLHGEQGGAPGIVGGLACQGDVWCERVPLLKLRLSAQLLRCDQSAAESEILRARCEPGSPSAAHL
jgi:hypothetical protein